MIDLETIIGRGIDLAFAVATIAAVFKLFA